MTTPAWVGYKALDFSGLDQGLDQLGERMKEQRSNAAIIEYARRQEEAQRQAVPGNLRTLGQDYGNPQTMPAPVNGRPLPAPGVQVAENEADTQRLERQMAESQSSPRASLINNESGGNWQAQNSAVGAGGNVGHFGRLQFGQARLQEAAAAGAIPQGITPQAFMQSPELQQRAESWHFNDIDSFIKQRGLDRVVGQPIGGVPATVDGMRAVAHLGGKEGLFKFVASGGQYNPADANGTRLSDYFAKHGGAGGQPGVQVAQAQGGPQSDADTPAPGASQAQGFAVPGGVHQGQGGSAGQIYGGAQPLNRQNLNVEGMKGLIQAGGAARQLGLKIFEQAISGRNYGFMTGPDGSVLRQDPRNGTVEVLIAGRPKTANVAEGNALVDEATGRVIYEGRPKREQQPQEVREFEYARSQGFGGSLLDYQRAKNEAKAKSPQVTAADQKAIFGAEDALPLIDNTIDTLKRALELNTQTYTGTGAGVKGQIGTSGLPGTGLIFDQNKAKATREFGQVMSMEAIKSMSETLKGATTDREMSRFMEILGDPSTPTDIRERTINRMLTLAERQKQIAVGRIDELRSKSSGSQGQRQQRPRQQPSMEGARQAGDGKTYVPDPSRPGKWLLVQP